MVLLPHRHDETYPPPTPPPPLPRNLAQLRAAEVDLVTRQMMLTSPPDPLLTPSRPDGGGMPA
eukprot:474658-Prorocentrum_minimum.AAC.1